MPSEASANRLKDFKNKGRDVEVGAVYLTAVSM